MTKRQREIYQARVYLQQARARRHQTTFHCTLLTWAANCRRRAADPQTGQQAVLFR